MFYSSISPENTLKNRYPNILTNETTRIKLRDIQPGGEDYVNANAVAGFENDVGYIATQAPLPGTMSHFWQMVYEDNCNTIVMLTREQEVQSIYPKCNRYWPSPGECILFGQYFVFGLGEQMEFSLGVIERKFRVVKALTRPQYEAPPPAASGTGSRTLWSADGGSDLSLSDNSFQTPVRRNPTRDLLGQHVDLDEQGNELFDQDSDAVEVTQIQYVEWPDQGVPDSPKSLLKICEVVDERLKGKPGERTPGRPVVHCSAGVGRTGTFIAVHKLLRAVYSAFPADGSPKAHTVPIIQELVADLKRSRSKMVQTSEQYRFIFIALAAGVELYRERIASNATS